ncbi:MAG: hypothetical protein ACI92S_001536, partial [Planctomycetaceae bacterium]
ESLKQSKPDESAFRVRDPQDSARQRKIDGL